MGIQEISRMKNFFIYDPVISRIRSLQLTETQLMQAMIMINNTPEWVFWYPVWDLQISQPCYTLLIGGS